MAGKNIIFMFAVAVMIIMAAIAPSCRELEDNRIPVSPVSIIFPTSVEWTIYGVPAAMSYKRFIRQNRVPNNFPWLATTQTGYGGVLLVGDVMGNPKAYDLSCPVECKPDIRISIDTSTQTAKCSKCGSEYDVFTLEGHPLSGPAAKNGYGLKRYRVGPGRDGNFMIVSN